MNQILISSCYHIPSKGIVLLGERQGAFSVNVGECLQIKFNGRLYQFSIVGIEKYELPLLENLKDQSNSVGLLIDEGYKDLMEDIALSFPFLVEIHSIQANK